MTYNYQTRVNRCYKKRMRFLSKRLGFQRDFYINNRNSCEGLRDFSTVIYPSQSDKMKKIYFKFEKTLYTIFYDW